MLLDDLLDYVTTSSVGVTSGTSLFAMTFPDHPDKAACLYETGGFMAVHTMAGSAGAAVAERPRVQIVTRAATYQGARMLSHLIFRALDGLNNTTINGTRYLQITAVSSPAAMGTDASGRPRVVCNYDIIKALHTSTST